MHTVTLSPASVALTAGGSPVVQTVTIGNVTDNPDDTTVSQPISVTVAGVDVIVNTSVTVDYPTDPVPVVSVVAASAEFTVSVATPVRDTTDPTVYTVQLTYSPV